MHYQKAKSVYFQAKQTKSAADLPSTYRRLDSFFRPEVVLPQAKESDFVNRDFMTGDWGRVRTQQLP